MFEKLKETILDAAQEAVEYAEKFYGSSEGKLKKEQAINFIVDKIKFPPFLSLLKPLAVKLLSAFIDEAVEAAVTLMKAKIGAGEM